MLELTRFKYSNFRAIKMNCPNLVSLTVAITGKSLFTSVNHINVEKVIEMCYVKSLFIDPKCVSYLIVRTTI